MKTNQVTPYMVIINYYTLVYLFLGTLFLLTFNGTFYLQIIIFLFWIYVVPPSLCRLILLFFSLPAGYSYPSTRPYKVWWLLTQFQVIFNRIPFFEEVLRMVPGLYGTWLNLWGSKVSLMAYWSPGVVVTDRYLLQIEKGAALGLNCTLVGHVITKDEKEGYRLLVAPIIVENGAVVGGSSMIGPGAHIHANELLPADRHLPPFTRWKDGKKHRITQPNIN